MTAPAHSRKKALMIDALLGNDLVINEDSCNLSCTYCLTGQSNLKNSHNDKLIFGPPIKDRFTSTSGLGTRLPIIDKRVDDTFRVPLLKVTGGEIFLIEGILDFLREQASAHEVLVVQTNGVLVTDEHLAAFREWGNVVLQVSLDSHLYAGNSYRVVSASLHAKVMRRICAILDSELPVEVYGVLNDRSVSDLEPFAQWLAERPGQVTFFPFPVRGPDAERFAVRPEQVQHIEHFVDRYDDFARVLPPLAYFRRLLSFYREGGRTFRCHLPRLVVSTFSDGMITPCPNIWFSDMGNLLEDGYQDSLHRVGETGLYRALLAATPRLNACRGCFTPWDTLSMYFDDEITLDELCVAPTYASPRVRSLIEERKRRYQEGSDGVALRA
jgi:MoaA/NifB/PqqE/SkfB family radical SAM enzyme